MFLGQNLTLARQRRSMKQTTLAKAIGVSANTISTIERGIAEPRSAHVEKLAETLNFPVEFFFDDQMAEPIGVNGASFRSLTRMTATQRDSAIASGAFCIRLNQWIEDRFELSEVDLPDVNPGLIDPEGAAAMVRSQWALGNLPIPNMLHLAEAHGVRVFALSLDCHEVDAFSFWAGRPFICLGTHKTPERSIFDLAHEIGHLILHRHHGAPRGRQQETEADAFASALLMPASDVKAHSMRFPTFAELTELKARWRVSAAALNFRLHRLGIISDWHYRENCIEIAKYGRHREPRSIRREQSFVLENVLRELRSEGISRADIARSLNIPTSDLAEMINGLAVSVVDGEGAPAASRRTDPTRASLKIVR